MIAAPDEIVEGRVFLQAAALKAEALQELKGTSPWRHSPFRWLQRLPPVPKHGQVKQLLVQSIRDLTGLPVDGVTDGNGASCLQLGTLLMSLKVSFLWEDGGYKFQQIRRGPFSHLVLFGLSPEDAHLWVIPTTEPCIFQSPQHVSRQGDVANYELTVGDSAPPSWLAPYGGTLADGLVVLSTLP